MELKIKKLFINGYGWTGSSAVYDYLSDCRDISIVPNEFDDLRVPYGFLDKVNMKIHQLNGKKSKSFSALADIEPNNKAISTRYKENFFIFKMLLRAFHIPIPFTKMWNKPFSYRSHFFSLFFKYSKEYSLTKNYLQKINNSKSIDELKHLPSLWLDNIASIYAKQNNLICFDQALLIDNAIDIMDYLKNTYILVVIRNPKKQFADILSKEVKFLHNYPWRVRYLIGLGSNDLNEVVNIFVRSTERRLNEIIKLKKKMKNKMLLIDFDDFLRNPEMLINKISHLTGLTLKNFNSSKFDIDKSRIRNENLNITDPTILNSVSQLKSKYMELKNYI